MLTRQKIVLRFLQAAAGGRANKLNLTKWAFLLAHETSTGGGATFYRFVPYAYGPYSFTLTQETAALARDGLLEDKDKCWQLTAAGARKKINLPLATATEIGAIMLRYGHMPTDDLLADVYERYPWFTVNSKRLERRAQGRPEASVAVYTAGYEGLLVDAFLDGLIRSGIQRLIDVRNNPVSRRFGFHKSTLARLCASLDVEYVHLPELGIPPSDREAIQTPADYANLFVRYQADVLPRETEKVREAAALVRSAPSVLVCMEADPEFCHRSRLANAVAVHTGLPVVHLHLS